jgi:AbrB family looped-hinge helix DNA binding protein
MEKNVAKVSTGFRVVIPKAIRERLSINAGDVVRFRTTNREVVVLERGDIGAFAVFEEWNSDEDTWLYRNL